MENEILYVFNSALRPLYKNNISKILSFPNYYTTTFRYTIGQNVPSELVGKDLSGMDCLIIYVDRFNEGSYKYYPIRKAKVLSSEVNANRLHVECSFGDYCQTENYEEFTYQLKKSVKGIPELVGQDPCNINDGYYMQVGKEYSDELSFDSSYWFIVVENLSKTKKLSEDHLPLLKISLKDETIKGKELLPVQSNVITLESDNTYDFNITYYDPDKGSVDKSILIKFNNPLFPHSSGRIVLGAKTNSVKNLFTPKSSFKISDIRSFIEVFVYQESNILYSLEYPLKISSQMLISKTFIIALILAVLIVLQDLASFPLSSLFELLKWATVLLGCLILGKEPKIT